MDISETKLDDSFPKALFSVDGYECYRCDRNSRGGGVLYYVRCCIPHRILSDRAMHESSGVEKLVLETKTKNAKCFFILMYRPPSVHTGVLLTAWSKC